MKTANQLIDKTYEDFFSVDDVTVYSTNVDPDKLDKSKFESQSEVEKDTWDFQLLPGDQAVS